VKSITVEAIDTGSGPASTIQSPVSPGIGARTPRISDAVRLGVAPVRFALVEMSG